MAEDYFDRICAYPDTTIRIETTPVNRIWGKRIIWAIPRKRWRIREFYKAFLEVTDALEAGHVYSLAEIKQTKYWEYIKGYHRSWREEPLHPRAYLRMRRKFWSGVRLFHNIKENGMRDSLDIIEENNITMLYRGYRRLVILKTLGIKLAEIRYATVNHSPSSE